MLIKGTRIMKLSEAIGEYCTAKYDFQDVLDKLPYTFNEEEYEEVKKECNKLSYEFVKIRSKAQEGLKLANDLKKMGSFGEDNVVKLNKKVSKLRKINSFIDKQSANELLEIYSSAETTDELNRINIMSDDEDTNLINTLETSCVVYKSLIKGIDELKPILEESLSKM